MLSKLLFYLLILVLFAAGAYWFSSGSGDMVLEWRDYELTTTTANFVFLMLIIVVVFSICIPAISNLLGLPKKWLKAREEKRFRQGLDHVTHTLVAISLGDTKSANTNLGKAKKMLPGQPIVPLMETQIAAATKDQTLLQRSLNDLQLYDQTKALASKGLAELHMRKGELISAIPFAKKAMELEPQNQQSFEITLTLYVKSKQFVYAETLIEDAKSQKIIDKYQHKELLAMLAHIRSTQDEITPEEARKYSADAYQLAPHQPHMFLQYITLHNAGTHTPLAIKAIKRSWEGCFTPALYELTKHVAVDDKEKKKLYNKLLGLSLDGKPYAYLLLAGLMLQQEDGKATNRYLEAYNELVKVPLELPEGGIDNIEYFTELLTQAEQEMDALKWVCDNCYKESDSWQAVCPGCQALNQCQTI